MRKLTNAEGYEWVNDPRYAMRLADGSKVKVGDLRRQMAVVIKAHIRLRSPGNETRRAGALIGERTVAARRQECWAFLEWLLESKYKKQRWLIGLKQRHFKAYADHLMSRGNSAKTLHVKISHWRTLAWWLGKPAMVPPNEDLLPADYQRISLAATADRSWTAQAVDVGEVIERIRASAPWVANVVDVQRAFGLRVQEAVQLRPHESDRDTQLWVYRGTKGGRERYVRIETDAQRALLDRLKIEVSPRKSLAPATLSLKQAMGKYYREVRKAGVSKDALGVVSHGLRHERLQEIYEDQTGEAAPIAGGGRVDPELDLEARQRVAEIAGHNRPAVSSAYLGPVVQRRLRERERARPGETPSSEGDQA